MLYATFISTGKIRKARDRCYPLHLIFHFMNLRSQNAAKANTAMTKVFIKFLRFWIIDEMEASEGLGGASMVRFG